eukprot:gene2397-18041_t
MPNNELSGDLNINFQKDIFKPETFSGIDQRFFKITPLEIMFKRRTKSGPKSNQVDEIVLAASRILSLKSYSPLIGLSVRSVIDSRQKYKKINEETTREIAEAMSSWLQQKTLVIEERLENNNSVKAYNLVKSVTKQAGPVVQVFHTLQRHYGKIASLLAIVKTRKLQWFGHVTRKREAICESSTCPCMMDSQMKQADGSIEKI